MSEEYILWTDFYKELAEKLLEYKNKRGDLFELIEKIYTDAKVKPYNLTGDKDFKDIDPFTIFALFNQMKQLDENRKRLIESIKKNLDLNSKIPNVFTGIPLLIPFMTRFYNLKRNPKEDIAKLWNLFETALAYSKEKNNKNKENFKLAFDNCRTIEGVGLSKMTIGLFWINPDLFISLDSKNEELLYHSDIIPDKLKRILPNKIEKINGDLYIDILEILQDIFKNNLIPFSNILELSDNAWKFQKSYSERSENGEAIGDLGINSIHYWIYSPGAQASKWDEFYENGILAIGWGEIGDLKVYNNKNDIRTAMQKEIDASSPFKLPAHAAWQFVHEMKPGDIVFAKNGIHEIIGKGVVTSDYEFDSSISDEYKNIRHIDWTDKGNWSIKEKLARKTLTDITNYTSQVEKINNLFDDNLDDVEEKAQEYPKYSRENFLEEVFLSENAYDKLKNILRRKKNLILFGAPGTGKTYASKRLAYSLMGEKNSDRVSFIQFHQSYTYEDFIMGFRPDSESNGFVLRNGPFYEFCKLAEIDSENDYFFIIDEINRGNLSKIFGELFTLLETDKRGISINLLYSDEKFAIPENVHIIGMMNTADRSLALIDYALRRRFAFFEFNPAFDSDGFKSYQEKIDNNKFNRLIDVVKLLNTAISQDDSLGRGFEIGHSYFCSLKNSENIEEVLKSIVEYEIIPLLQEYWYDEQSKVEEWKTRLIGALE